MERRARERQMHLALGYGSLLLFAASIIVLVWFLLAGVGNPESWSDAVERELLRRTEGRADARATFNVLLMVAWGFLHSFMARPRFKVKFQKVVSPHLQPAIYAIVASAGLISLCLLYRPIPRVVYALEGGPALLTRCLFYTGWALFLYCWFHLDVLEIVGLRPILCYVHAKAQPLEPFQPTGPFLWVRHPVELSFLIAFWATPRMTVGHLLFASVMTLYTFIGIDLEDRRMLELHGTGYQNYLKKVPQILPLPR